jgi:hypothetical protein
MQFYGIFLRIAEREEGREGVPGSDDDGVEEIWVSGFWQ